MSTQIERTEAFIEANNQPRYVPMHEALGVYIARVDALQAHCRELARRLDAGIGAPTSMKVIYIAGPYRAANQWGVEQNIRTAEAAMMQVAAMGMTPLCPHTMTRYMDGTLTDDYWLMATMELLRRCDGMLLCGDWAHSEGTLGECREARERGIPIYESLYELSVAVAA